MSMRNRLKTITPNWIKRLAGTDRLGYRRISALGADSPNEWIRKSADIDGWLFEGEHELLWELATASTEGHVLEIGTWMGKSACIFAGACLAVAPQTRVFCVDPFTMMGSASQEEYHRRLLGKSAGTFYQFQRNASRLGFLSQVVPLATTSDRALPHLPDGLRLVFVDARHDYEGVKTDVELALPKLRPGGVLALHDVTIYEDVGRYVESELKLSPALRFMKQVNSIAAFVKQ